MVKRTLLHRNKSDGMKLKWNEMDEITARWFIIRHHLSLQSIENEGFFVESARNLSVISMTCNSNMSAPKYINREIMRLISNENIDLILISNDYRSSQWHVIFDVIDFFLHRRRHRCVRSIPFVSYILFTFFWLAILVFCVLFLLKMNSHSRGHVQLEAIATGSNKFQSTLSLAHIGPHIHAHI